MAVIYVCTELTWVLYMFIVYVQVVYCYTYIRVILSKAYTTWDSIKKHNRKNYLVSLNSYTCFKRAQAGARELEEARWLP